MRYAGPVRQGDLFIGESESKIFTLKIDAEALPPLNPKSEISNPQPSTLNPQPSTQNQKRGMDKEEVAEKAADKLVEKHKFVNLFRTFFLIFSLHVSRNKGYVDGFVRELTFTKRLCDHFL